MVEIAELPPQPAPVVVNPESDFSPRKLKVAAGILIGQSFGTSILPYSAIFLLQLPLTRQFHWTAEQFGWAVTFLFTFGGLSLWPIGRFADKVGVRPVLLIGTVIVGAITLLTAFQDGSLWQFYTLERATRRLRFDRHDLHEAPSRRCSRSIVAKRWRSSMQKRHWHKHLSHCLSTGSYSPTAGATCTWCLRW